MHITLITALLTVLQTFLRGALVGRIRVKTEYIQTICMQEPVAPLEVGP